MDMVSSNWVLHFPSPLSFFLKKKKHEKRGRKENRIALEEGGCDKSDYGTRDILMEPTWI